MRSLDDFIPYVTEDLAGVPHPAMQRALISACIDFCNKTLLLQQTLDNVTSITGTGDYEIEAPKGYKIAQVMVAWYDGVPLEPVNADELDDLNQDWTTETGTPKHLVMLVDDVVTLYPAPDQRGKVLKIRAALTPSRDAAEVDDVLYEDYVEDIAAGAKAKLCMSPNKIYTNPQLAAMFASKFKAGINNATLLRQAGKTRAEQQVRIPSL